MKTKIIKTMVKCQIAVFEEVNKTARNEAKQ